MTQRRRTQAEPQPGSRSAPSCPLDDEGEDDAAAAAAATALCSAKSLRWSSTSILYSWQYRNHRMYDSVDIAITFPGSNLAHDRPQ